MNSLVKNLVCVRKLIPRVGIQGVGAAMGLVSMAAFAQQSPAINSNVSSEGAGKMVITAQGIPPAAPLFFNAEANNKINLSSQSLKQTINLQITVLQGEAKQISLEITGLSEKLKVSGTNLADWAIRRDIGSGKNYLDLIPKDPKNRQFKVALSLQHDLDKESSVKVLSLSPNKAAGFSQTMDINWDASTHVNLAKANGCQPIDTAAKLRRITLISNSFNEVVLGLKPAGSALADVEMRDMNLSALVAADGKSATVTLTGLAHVTGRQGGSIKLISGHLALQSYPHGAPYNLELVRSRSGETHYSLQFDKTGDFPVEMKFAARLSDSQGWAGLDLRVPNGAVVPVTLNGVPAGSRFQKDGTVVPKLNDAQGWSAYLPANGHCLVRWKPERNDGDSELFFTSQALVDVNVGAGMLRETTKIEIKIMQGELRTLRLKLDGLGDIIALSGEHVGSWKVINDNANRFIEVTLTGARSEVGSLSIQSQHPLGNFPAKVQPLRITPENALRHAGYIRLSNRGAVRLGVSSLKGMMQLSPEQFPASKLRHTARQVFVYRFPSAERSWEITADQILPEVTVNQVLVYKLSETDRELHADIELDIREAPLREWEMRIPADYAVASVTGAEVAQMVVGRSVTDGQRGLKITFSKEVIGRQLIKVRLARNVATSAGNWKLVKIHYPQAKSVRGHIGIEAALGWRVIPGKIDNLVEMPLAYFPQKSQALQQAFRLRDADWSANIKIEALGQSVQADVFHLYSLKEGMVYGSVLINYFVIGAPMNEWKIFVPGLNQNGGINNVLIEGQNVRSWRQDGEHIIVTLHQPALGGTTLLVSFETPMSIHGGEIQLGQVRPIDASSEGGFIQVVSPTQVKPTIKTAKGLLKLGALELPAEYRLMSSAPSLAAWQYANRDFQLNMQVDWYQPGETVGQVVDFANLNTKVSRDGQMVTEATFYVKTRGRKTLDMSLPAGATLWEVRADGQTINARRNGEAILLPLPAKDDPNSPVKVVVRYGGEASNPSKPVVGVPRLSAPVAITEWKVTSDRGYLLRVDGGDVKPVIPNYTETGFEWQKSHLSYLFAIILLILAASWAMRSANSGGWKPFMGALWLAIAIFIGMFASREAYSERRVNRQSFEVVAPVIAPEKAIELQMSNQPTNRAMRSTPWAIVGGLGALTLLASLFQRQLRNPLARALAISLLALGLLGQHGGAVPFYLFTALLALGMLFTLLRSWFTGCAIRHAEKKAAKAIAAAKEFAKESASSTASVLLALLCWFGATAVSDAATLADSQIQNWDIRDERLSAKLEVTWKAEPGDSIVLLRAPATLTQINAPGMRVGKELRNGVQTWFLVAERAGILNASARYEMPMKGLTDQQWKLPTADSAMHRLRVTVDQPKWEITSAQAVRSNTLEGLDPRTSGAELILSPLSSAAVSLRPQRRDPNKEDTRFFTETADLYIPSPGVVDGWHKLVVRPVSGRVADLVIDIPAGMMVGDVIGNNIEDWRFDPNARTLQVNLAKPSSSSFSLLVMTQRGLEELPQALRIAPLKVRKATTVVGVFGLAFGNDAQPDNIKATGFSAVNLGDFDSKLWQQVRAQRGKVVLQKAYRYGKDPAQLDLQVEPVAAELRVVSKQRLSLGEERMIFSINTTVDIVRAGVFELNFTIPNGFEVESISGNSLRDWTEIEKEGKRVAVLQLNGRTQGQQQFALTLAGTSPANNGSQAEWEVPHVEMLGAVRQTGELLVVPGQGIRVRVIQRQHVSQQDARHSGTHRKGDLAFRLLQSDWKLSIGIEKLDPWVRATALQEVSLREGQTRTRLSMIYQVENAAVKSLQLRLPSLTEEEIRTVRASGSAIKEMVQIEGDKWEVRLRRGMIGSIAFQVEFQRSVEARGAAEVVSPAILSDARQVIHYVSVRASGRLDMVASDTRGWRSTDWSSIPKALRNPADSSVPGLCFHVAEPEDALTVNVQRHEVADTLKLRVLNGKLTTIFAADSSALTLVELKVRVVEKHTMSAVLPEGAELFSVTINGESVDVVRQEDEHLFYVTPDAQDTENRHADVRIMYRSVGSGEADKAIKLVGPRFNAPLEKVDWYVSLPEGHKLVGRSDSFDLMATMADENIYGQQEYQSAMDQQRKQQVDRANIQMEQANNWISSGDYKKAEQVLSQVAGNRAVDAASNEDARVQLRKLRNQQAFIALNTRRQKLYLDNKADGNTVVHNGALEEAAKLNPLFKGETNYQQGQIDDLLQGTTEEERRAMQNIANRMIGQQLAAQPAPQAIDVTMPQHGQLLHFHRSIQLSADTPIALELEIEQQSSYSWLTVLGLSLLIFVSSTTMLVLRKS